MSINSEIKKQFDLSRWSKNFDGDFFLEVEDGEVQLRGGATYNRSSVLEGQFCFQTIEWYDSMEDAEQHLGTKLFNLLGEPRGHQRALAQPLPSCAPEWFDPADAGEEW